MNKLIKNYISDSYYDFLLLLSIVIVTMSMYIVLQNNHTLMSHPLVTMEKTEKRVSIVLSKAYVLEEKKKVVPKKRTLKAKKKIVKKLTPIKKELVKTETLVAVEKEEVIMKEELLEEIFMEEVLEEVIAQEEVPHSKNISKPVFDTHMKEEFIAGLYEILNQNKHYPKMAKRRHLEGIAHVQFTLLKDGRLVHTLLYKSCGHQILDRAALKLVSEIKRYKPIPDSVSLAALDLNIPIKYSR